MDLDIYKRKGEVDGQNDSEGNSVSHSLIDLPKVRSAEGCSVSDTGAYSDGQDGATKSGNNDEQNEPTPKCNTDDSKEVILYKIFVEEIKEEELSDTEESSDHKDDIVKIIIKNLNIPV